MKFDGLMQKQLTIFVSLKKLFIYLCFFSGLLLKGQDRVYLMDGSVRIAKVTEIGPDYITIVPLSESGAPFVNANETILKRDVILIEYKNGVVEVYTLPDKSAIYNANGSLRKDARKNEQEFAFNFASINSLALCNADLSFFFERLLQSKKIGVGAMAAYNFNRYATLPNIWFAVLNNAKKKYDIGAFANFYPTHFKRRTTFYFGILFKYTAFDFSKIIEEKSGTAVNIKYLPAKGSQMATIFNIGTHSNFGNSFFFKTMFGIGGFVMRGDYKEQFNYMVNRDREPTDPVLNYSFLPKAYVGFNLGFVF